jgi:DNA-binding Lrp family transcriptional regulator
LLSGDPVRGIAIEDREPFADRVVARDIADYERFFFDVLSQAPGVREANSMVILTEAKSTTKLPVDELVV